MNRQAFIVAGLIVAFVVTWLIRLNTTSSTTDIEAADRVPDGEQRASFDSSVLNPTDIAAPPTRRNDSQPNVSAKALYLIDTASAYPLYAQNEEAAVPIASTTKIMTAVIVVESYQLEDTVTISETAASTIGSEIQLVPGEQITVDALLKALMIQSGNDAAMALAEHMGLDTFIGKMNTKAAQLGLTNTKFRDPAGLDDTGRSSARDLGILAAYALRNQTIAGIAQLTEATVESTDGRISHKVETSNRLIKPDHPLFVPGATGLKTGFTPDAGHCLVASATRDGHQLVSVVLNTTEQTTEASAKESRKLFDWAFNNYQWE